MVNHNEIDAYQQEWNEMESVFPLKRKVSVGHRPDIKIEGRSI